MKFTIDVVEFMRHRDTSFEQINFIEKMQPGCFPKKCFLIFMWLSRLLFILYHKRGDDALAEPVKCRYGSIG